jgi:hypothetical protein
MPMIEATGLSIFAEVLAKMTKQLNVEIPIGF